MTTPSNPSPSLPRAFQFRLATLLIATAWAALISLGLRTPTPLWSGVIAVVTLLTVLLAVLFVIYRTSRTRAMAIGFLVFCVGYLAYRSALEGSLRSGLNVSSTFILLFNSLHPGTEIYTTEPGRTTTWPSPYYATDFIAICHHALACLLGVAGSIAAQILHSTQHHEAATNARQ